MSDALPAYAELHAISNFSFLRGASHPEELVQRAHHLGYAALALTDECSVAGVVRAHSAAKALGFRLLLGAEFWLDEGGTLVAIARDVAAWGDLCEFITAARQGCPKGQYQLSRHSANFALLRGCEVIVLPARDEAALTAPHNTRSQAPNAPDPLLDLAHWAYREFGASAWLGLALSRNSGDALWLQRLQQLSAASALPLLACGSVQMHLRSRKPLHDVLCATRLNQAMAQCGWALHANAERRLRQRLSLAQLYPAELLARTLDLMQRCTFNLDQIRYQYPLETVPPGLTATQALRQFTWAGARQRYPKNVPYAVRRQLVRELALIADCGYEMFFLTVHDIVRFARQQGILCQGRGSAANSAVCYCLGITAVDPSRSHLLFERFISRERREPPDIDVDFEHERREEVIQYIYQKYGRERAAIAAVVTCYRPRSALRDVGKALGLPPGLIEQAAKNQHWFDQQLRSHALAEQAPAYGLAADDPRLAQWLELAQQLLGFPRHLSQHVGGFVLTQGKLTRLVPVENAAMPERSVIQWDKDDLEDMGLLKVDVLALGMLSALRRCLALRNARYAASATAPWGLHDIPAEDPSTYDMICRADTVGVFQIESRAQMSMLPRLAPRAFYDLVIEVAIVRPGPIQGGMVHPYLKARERVRQRQPIHYENPALKPALERTLGVPIFQEQVMQIAMIAAGFSAAQADALRRSMAAWKRRGGVHHFEQAMVQGMLARGYRLEFAQAIFKQILGFGEYGFPESHAYSFALLSYASSWLKYHEPECFLAALLNSQPMGFYGPSQLVQDAQRHGVQVLPADVSYSHWDCTLEPPSGVASPLSASANTTATRPAVRLGLRMVAGLSQSAAQAIINARQQIGFNSVSTLNQQASLNLKDLKALANADALASVCGPRREQVWQAAAHHTQSKHSGVLLQQTTVDEVPVKFTPAPEGEEILWDYAATGLSLRRHPLALLRAKLARQDFLSAQALRAKAHGSLVKACGLVSARQQPQTAKGTLFITLEDETGAVNVIVWKDLRERQRQTLLHARLLAITGQWQRDSDSGGQVCHLIAQHCRDLSPWLGRLAQLPSTSRDFH